MKIRVRIAMAAVAGVFLPVPAAALAQDFPTRAIRIILPFAPGGGTDVLARVLAPRLQDALGQSTVVDNRPGASGNIGTELTVKSPPDGHTLMLTTTAVAVNVTLYPKLPFDARKDLIAITQLGSTSSVLSLHPAVPARSVKELVALSKRTRGGLNFGSNGSGTSSHLAGAMFAHVAGVALTHIPYKGAAPAINALVGGEVEVAFPGVNSVMPMLRAGKVRALAVLSEKRVAALADVPTAQEAGVDNLVVPLWYGMLAPAGTPRAIIDRLNSELHKALASPDLKERLANAGVEPLTDTPEHFAEFIKAEMARYAKVVKDAGIKTQ